ncbi:acetylglutamate kinase [Scopulibacillus daqui]|uniref:Acetylglutamate kinase n=1 Tax=Scopulibacillus daqui TaxID=1469162 RepID=A0ABS2PWW0_9BACL|nr:acetylglutamate kinase [Scopulibacillus daqui]MBM7644549.1 acetylglutamate kinase [Scopulibacillus daqui]
MNFLVIKCGGSVVEKLPDRFYENIADIQKSGKWLPVIVHGGGPLISSFLNKLNIETSFRHGLRVTTEEVLDAAEIVLSGLVNKQIVRKLSMAKGKAFGMSGADGHLLTAVPVDDSGNLGFVGKIGGVKSEWLIQIIKEGYIPVISPISLDAKGQRYNINADAAASAIAQALKAHLCFISDIPGIWIEEDGKKKVLNKVTQQEVVDMIAEKKIAGGMIPKVQAAIESLLEGVPEVVILNGFDDKSLLDYTNNGRAGTKIILEGEAAHV